MSYFSQSFAAYMQREQLTNLRLAAQSELPDSELSKWRRGLGAPTQKALCKLLDILPEPVALRLTIDWLRDECPEAFANKIAIQPALSFQSVETLHDDEFEAAVAGLRELAKHNHQVKAVIGNLWKLLNKAPAATVPVHLNDGRSNEAPLAQSPVDYRKS